MALFCYSNKMTKNHLLKVAAMNIFSHKNVLCFHLTCLQFLSTTLLLHSLRHWGKTKSQASRLEGGWWLLRLNGSGWKQRCYERRTHARWQGCASSGKCSLLSATLSAGWSWPPPMFPVTLPLCHILAQCTGLPPLLWHLAYASSLPPPGPRAASLGHLQAASVACTIAWPLMYLSLNLSISGFLLGTVSEL